MMKRMTKKKMIWKRRMAKRRSNVTEEKARVSRWEKQSGKRSA